MLQERKGQERPVRDFREVRGETTERFGKRILGGGHSTTCAKALRPN